MWYKIVIMFAKCYFLNINNFQMQMKMKIFLNFENILKHEIIIKGLINIKKCKDYNTKEQIY